MIIWQSSWHEPDTGHCIGWHATRREAALQIKAKKDEMPDSYEPAAIRKYKVRGTKASFISWLNQHFTTDNG